MRRLLPVLAAGILAFGAAACGGESGGSGDGGGGGAESGPEARAFSDACGQCHTFAPAGTQGSVGPPLDGTALSAAEIARQIEQGGDGMPPGLLAGEERQRVASWIAENAGG